MHTAPFPDPFEARGLTMDVLSRQSGTSVRRRSPSSTLKVTAVHTDFRLYWVARLSHLRRELLESGIELTVIEISGRGSPYDFAQTAGPKLGWWNCLYPAEAMEEINIRAATKRLWHALDAERPDVVFAGAIAFPSGAISVRWARARGKRVVIMDDARACDVPRNALVNGVKQRIYSNVDAVLLPAPSHIPDYEYWGIDRAKMFFGVNVVDNDYYGCTADQVRAEAARWRADLNLPKKFVLGVGRQVPKKNWSLLLRAWRLFKDERPATDLHLVLVGNGPERASLKLLSESLHLHGTRFVDFRQITGVAPFYALATALVLPSLNGETWGLVVNEAMASGLPVLVSRQCGSSQTLVVPGENGWVFDGENGRELASLFARLSDLSEPQLAVMGKRSREIISQWGLERFSSGALAAIQYALAQPDLRPSVLDRLILRAWKGRYRPT
jgi:glycosyltransferase involved in cell wall biosynthesis